MDPADSSGSRDLLEAVARQGATLAQHETLMTKHDGLLSDILTSLQEIFRRLPATPDPVSVPVHQSVSLSPSPLAEPRLPPPQHFSGDPSACNGFLTQCALTFELQPSSFPSDRSKIAYIITLLSGRALSWATAVWEARSPFCSSYASFVEEFRRVFNHPLQGREASKELLSIKQGNRSVAEYAIQFRTIAATSGWDKEALIVCFQNGLSEIIQDELATKDPPDSLEVLIDMAIRLDNRLRERVCSRKLASPTPVRPLAQVFQEPHEPMQLGGTRISPAERERRMRERCCLYCGLPGHFRAACPELSGKAPSRADRGGL